MIASGKIAFGKTEVIDGIQQVCLALTILSAYSNNSFIKMKTLPGIILELNE